MHELTGQALFSLLLGSKGWIHRRLVVVDFAEAGQLRQEVILDFTLPRDIVGRVEAGQVAVPLALMVKGARIGFDVTGPGGQAVPILNTSQQAGPVTALLDHAFRWAWPGERLDESMRAAIDSMVTAVTFAESRIHMRKVLDSLPPGPHGQGRSRERATFEALMRSLAHNYLLLGVLPTGVVGQRSVLRYAFLSYPLRRLASGRLHTSSTAFPWRTPAFRKAFTWKFGYRTSSRSSPSGMSVHQRPTPRAYNQRESVWHTSAWAMRAVLEAAVPWSSSSQPAGR